MLMMMGMRLPSAPTGKTTANLSYVYLQDCYWTHSSLQSLYSDHLLHREVLDAMGSVQVDKVNKIIKFKLTTEGSGSDGSEPSSPFQSQSIVPMDVPKEVCILDSEKLIVVLQSPPPIPPISGLTKKRRYLKIGGIGSHI